MEYILNKSKQKYLKRILKKKPLELFHNLINEVERLRKIKVYKVLIRNIGICIEGITISAMEKLTKIAERTYPKYTSNAKSLINRLSYFFNLSQKKLALTEQLCRSILSIGKERLEEYIETYEGRKIVIIDETVYPKRARLDRRGKGMELVGWVYDTKKGKPVKGYCGILAGFLLKDKNVLPIIHKLFSYNWLDVMFHRYKSLNKFELGIVSSLVKFFPHEELLIVWDAHFAKKIFLEELTKKFKNIKFLVRTKSEINLLNEDGYENIWKKINRVKEAKTINWFYPEIGKTIKGRVRFLTGDLFPKATLKKSLKGNVVVVEPLKKNLEPIVLFTNLKVKLDNLEDIAWLYIRRWSIEIAIGHLKNKFGLGKAMVRKFIAQEVFSLIALISYMVYLLILLTSKTIYLFFIQEFLRKTTILAKNKLSFGKLVNFFSYNLDIKVGILSF